MRIRTEKQQRVLGGLCFHGKFHTEKQRGFGGTALL